MKISSSVLLVLLTGLALAACQSALSSSDESPAPSLTATIATANIATIMTTSPDEKPPVGAETEFITDFSIHSISYKEVLSGGLPKDGIPSIDHPAFVSIQEADAWQKPEEPVILVAVDHEAKAYPLQILIWHEIVNDTIGEIPIIVTFCPLCNTAIAFDRTVNGQVLDFGTTGRLRFSNLIMYDRQTETWWQQAEGKGIAGSLTGTQLEFVPAGIISWREFKNAYPEGLVLSRETGFSRSYGQNPYIGYDDINQPPFLYTGPTTPGQLPALARVLTLDIDGDVVAYPYEVLSRMFVINDRVGDEEIAIFWSPGTASALDTSIISEGKDVGTAIAYNRSLEGMLLSFKYDGQNIIDEQTNSIWDMLGHAISGELQGQQLIPEVSVNHFWFSWAAFKPGTRIYQP